MADWGVADLAQAIASVESANGVAAFGTAVSAPVSTRNPQDAGWAAPEAYDYATYNRTTKELHDESTVGGTDKDWASNSARYEWNDEYGDVGPAIPELELQLFGSEEHVRSGIQFDKINEIEVTQEGTVCIEPVRSFANAGLHPVMMSNVNLARYQNPTPVQSYTLPAILKGYDVVACAQTGSGKTAAYLVPTLSKLMGKAKKLAAPRPNPATYREGVDKPVRAEPLLLVVCPNRELATQIFDEARRFCYRSMLRPCVLYGGGPVAEQAAQIQKGCDVLIATPGRLCDFINRPHILSLHRIKYLIIDEADEMLNADWEPELKMIMSGSNQETGNITYMMFSATFPKLAREIAKEYLAHDHVRIRVGRAGSSHVNIKQTVVYVEQSMKRQALLDLIFANPPARSIVFVNSKRAADELDDYLFNLNLPCTSIHSDRTQREREDALRAFRTGKTPILIATGVSSRGLDIRNVMHIINYDLPTTQYGGIDEYIHRIGRTGRIGNLGLSTAFYNDKNEDIAEVLTKILIETGQDVPDFLQPYVPEDTADLKFEEDSEDENALAIDGNEDGGWGAPVTEPPGGDISGGWDAEPDKASETAHGATSTATVKPVTETIPPTLGSISAAPTKVPEDIHNTSSTAADSWGSAVDSSTW